MTPTTSSPSSVLLNPVVQSGNSTVTTNAEAAPDAALSGFQLLLGAMQQLQQQQPAQADGVDTQVKHAESGNADGGNALPPLGTILPAMTLSQATSDQTAPAGETKAQGKKDSDADIVTIDAMPTAMVVPAVVVLPSVPAGFVIQSPRSSATKTAEATDALVSGLALASTDIPLTAQSSAQQVNEAGRVDSQAVAPMSSAGANTVDNAVGASNKATDTTTNTMVSTVANTTAIAATNTIVNTKEIATADTKTKTKVDLSAVTAANTTTNSAVITATVPNEPQGVSKPTAASDFDELIKHFDATTPAPRAPVNTIGDNASVSVGTGISTQQAARTYFDAANTTTSIAVPVGNSGWSDAVTDKVMWFSAQKISSAEIHLNPPDLGPLQVRVSTQHDQTSVVFTSQHAAVRDALDQALPRLRDMMSSQGQTLDVSVGGQSAQQQQQQFSRNGAADRGASFGGMFADDPVEAATLTSVTAIDTARLRSGVDAYA